MNYNGIIPAILAAIFLIMGIPSAAEAADTIEFNGRKFDLSSNTVILDREGLTGCRDAVTDPAVAFDRINAIGSDAVLLVAPSVYWLDDPDDPQVRTDKGGTPFAVRLKCDSLSIIGLADNPEDIVFAVNRGQTQGAVGNYTMFQFSGRSLKLENVTFGNYCNTDLVYPRDTSQNRLKRKDAIVQAQIGICDGTDRLFAENCRFISRLNLCPFVGARRSLYDSCYFECTDDALSGSAVYLDCRFTFFSSKPFYSTAQTGAVFLNCDITCLGSGVQYFTKVPGQVTAIDTRFHSEKPIEIKWTRDASDIVCRQENISLNGKPYIIDSQRPELGPSLTDSLLRNAYKIEYDGKTVYNLPNLLNGDDGWDPKSMNSDIDKIAAATGKRLTGIPVAIKVEEVDPRPVFNGDKVVLRTSSLLWGGYTTGPVNEMEVVADNTMPIKKEAVIPISTPEGLTARHTMTIEPNLRKAPEFRKGPEIRFDANSGKFVVDYSLKGKGEDRSSVAWYRVKEDCGKVHVYELVNGDAPCGREFSAKAGDFGSLIVAVVTPRYVDSSPGLAASTEMFVVDDISMVDEMPEAELSTDFSAISIEKREPGIPGIWNFDVFKPADTSHVEWQAAEGPGWYFGKGFDASTGVGLVQSEKGARISYVPARDICRDMTVSLVAEPAKSGGQGFGSATTQYMDICVKFDPVSLDGYALRIERTPEHDRAVSFSLIKYDKGLTSRISEEVISDCFRNPCHISVGVTDGVLNATAYTEASDAERKCCDKVVGNVALSVPVDSSPLTGFCIQHTGSTGPSSTLLRDLNINWK